MAVKEFHFGTLHGERSERTKRERPMNAIVLTVASTAMARACDRVYRDHRRDRINLKFNAARIAGEEGVRRRCVGQGAPVRNLGFPIPAGKLARKQSATKP
jgi:hypothetical protein